MDTKKQNFKEPKETAPASKKAAGSQQNGNQESTSVNKGASPNQPTSLNKGAAGENVGGKQDLLQHAKHATDEIVSEVQQIAGSQLTRQREVAATDLSSVVDAVRRFGESLGGEESGPIARYAAEYGDKAADSLERLSTYIREQDPKRVLGDLQNFGRRRPALLLGGAFLLGFAGARLIKSSMDTESQQSFQKNVPARPSTANVSAPRSPNVSAARPSTTPNAF